MCVDNAILTMWFWVDRLEAKVDKMVVSGTPQQDFVPKMITSQVQDKDQVREGKWGEVGCSCE